MKKSYLEFKDINNILELIKAYNEANISYILSDSTKISISEIEDLRNAAESAYEDILKYLYDLRINDISF